MREVITAAPVSALERITPAEAALEQAATEMASDDRRRRREALLHNLELARARRRRQALNRFA